MNYPTQEQLRQAASLSLSLTVRWYNHVMYAMQEFGIDTPARQAAFIAQIFVESAGFTRTVENLNYSPAGLIATFPRKRISTAQANALGRQPGEKVVPTERQRQIANLVYGGRYGNDGPDDGWRFRGRGLKQITFYDNYLQCGHALELDLIAQPELLENDELAARSAGWFWYANNCNQFADARDIEGLTRRINGGLNGINERVKQYQTAWGVLCG
ncbi:glycoside hydrolase family 19 protein [Leminorella grimontii]|uniref:glycoside hydrolase family 19 protein n=1 Tax=Leminorella grimontii TaxID=82981 RepID=UPI00321FDDAC